MTTELIRYTLPETSVTVDPEFVKERDTLLARAAEITSVTTPNQNILAVQRARDLKSFGKTVETMRRKAKEPMVDLGKRIDAAAKDFLAPVESELKAMEERLAAFQMAEAARVREEQARIDAAKAEAMAEEAKAKELAADAAKKAARKNASAEVLKAALEAEAAVLAAKQRAEDAIRAKLPEAERASGQVTRNVIRYEIMNLDAVYAAKPHWFERVLKRSVVNDEVFMGLEVPGLRIWEETVIGVRS